MKASPKAASRSPHVSQTHGPSQRQLRVGELIRRTLSEALARGDIHDPDLDGASITVGEVRASPDLKQATAFVLPLGGGHSEAILDALRRNKGELRRQVARGLTLRHVPDLRFEIDETYDRLDATRRLFADERVRRDVVAEEGSDGEGSDGEDASRQDGMGDRSE